MKQRVYSNGLPFTNSLAWNIEATRERIELGKASLITIDGLQGEGKTTLGIHIAEYFQGSPLDLDKALAVGGEDFTNKLQMCMDDKRRVIVYDEASDFSRRAFQSNLNKNLNRIFDTYRVFKILPILILPSVRDLDRKLLDKGVIRFHINCRKRTANAGQFAIYSLWRLHYIMDKMKRIAVPPQAYQYTDPNSYGGFYNLSTDRAKELAKLTANSKEEIVNSTILGNKGLYTCGQIAKELGVSVPTIHTRIKRHKIKEDYKHKRTRYYSREAINQIKDFINNK